jgi:hypothetical protein
MPVTIKVNGTVNSLVHKTSNGISIATIPDVCKTPSPAGPVPIPYPNIAQSVTLTNGTTTVKGDKMMAANKGSKFALSNGDQAGTVGGVKSNVFMKEATWILYSFDVKLQGKGACRLADKMFHNSQNTVNLGGAVNPPVPIADFEKTIQDCVNAAAENWKTNHPGTEFKTFCASQANRKKRGKEIEDNAFDCIEGEMKKSGQSDQITIDTPYDRNGPGGSLRTCGARGQVVASTSRPDIVLHAPGNNTSPRAVYDIKAPCPPGSNLPSWRGNQGADYLIIFRIAPKLVSPGNKIMTGKLGTKAGAIALRSASKLLRIPLPWP